MSGELYRVALVVVLAAVVSDRLAFRLGGWERVGGAGRDRPKSRTPGWLADRRARRAAVGGSPLTQ
ncbi:hypothetical protein [Microbispora hainanensis]|uniref:Uncharacterized protein n=1 Tax=Microbispora hainanensis TaxID=568844 RepID=A0A544YMR0_9ACTN|nr:hypothetical protein [Microbispora hainanensis]TQS18078.1 hypothetical protein FLX08_25850 [Microbispora hainanensis]